MIEESTPLANETTYQKLGERFASFFRLQKSATVTEDKDVEAGTEEVMEEVDATKTETEKKEEIDETTEEEKSAETTPLANEIKSQTFADRVASFFRLRKTESLNKTEDAEAGTEKVVENVDVSQTKTEKKEEVTADETEGEKGEKDGEEKEKSIVKTKTDILSCFAGICNKGGNGEKTEEKKEEETDKETEKKDDEKQVNKHD